MDINTYTQICIELSKIDSLHNREKCIFEYYKRLIEIKNLIEPLQDKKKYNRLVKIKFVIKKLLSLIEIKNPKLKPKPKNYHNDYDDYYSDDDNYNNKSNESSGTYEYFTVQPWTGDPNICIFD